MDGPIETKKTTEKKWATQAVEDCTFQHGSIPHGQTTTPQRAPSGWYAFN
jgi:hypothetical protein